jgi:hypothetical protein
VTVADPAVGTGTFLLGAFRRIAATVEEDQGAGAVRGAVEAAAKRVIGFELQFGPFAVAQSRRCKHLWHRYLSCASSSPTRSVIRMLRRKRSYRSERLPSLAGTPIRSRSEPITVVIGNPPYKVDAAGQGGRIEAGSPGRPSALDLWMPPAEWGVGQRTKHLKNLYVYFWRWATWKVFGSGHATITGETESDRAGLDCFITAAGFLNGRGFQKMREDLRRECTNIWVIDCSPEGHQPDIPTRIFEGVQQEVCIVLASRTSGKIAVVLRGFASRPCRKGHGRKSSRPCRTLRSTGPNGPKGQLDEASLFCRSTPRPVPPSCRFPSCFNGPAPV